MGNRRFGSHNLVQAQTSIEVYHFNVDQDSIKILHNLRPEVQEKLSAVMFNFGIDWHFMESYDLCNDFNDVNVLWIDMKVKVDQRLISSLPSLRFIVSPTTGLTHIDTRLARKKCIEIISLRGESDFLESISASSEFAWTLTLSIWRNLPLFLGNAYAGVENRERFASLQLRQKTLGLIGFGRIGRQLCRYGKAFGMHVVFFDKSSSIRNSAMESSHQATSADSIQELCAISDIIIVAASHQEEDEKDYPLIGPEELAMMKSDAILINIARGSLIDENAVALGLVNGTLRGFGTDVLTSEEINNNNQSPFNSLMGKGYNLIISPHIGGMCRDAFLSCQLHVAKRLLYRFSTLDET